MYSASPVDIRAAFPSGRRLFNAIMLGVMILAACYVALSSDATWPRTWMHQDKVEHLIGFAGLTMWASAVFGPANWGRIAVFSASIALLLEVAQGLPGVARTVSLWDGVFSLLGVLSGIAILVGLRGVVAAVLSRREETTKPA